MLGEEQEGIAFQQMEEPLDGRQRLGGARIVARDGKAAEGALEHQRPRSRGSRAAAADQICRITEG